MQVFMTDETLLVCETQVQIHNCKAECQDTHLVVLKLVETICHCIATLEPYLWSSKSWRARISDPSTTKRIAEFELPLLVRNDDHVIPNSHPRH